MWNAAFVFLFILHPFVPLYFHRFFRHDSMTPFLADPPSRRVVALAAAAGAVLPTILTWTYFVALRNSPTAVQQTAYALGKGAEIALPLLWILAFCRQARPRRLLAAEGVVEGLVFGGGVAAAMLLAYRFWLEPAGLLAAAGKEVAAKARGLGVGGPVGFAVCGVFYAAIHSLFEEWYWRWFVFGRMRRLVSPAAAIALSSAAFAAHHVVVLGGYFGWTSPATAACTLGVAAGGAAWAWLYERHGSLLGPWISHALVDAAIFAVGFSLIHAAAQ